MNEVAIDISGTVVTDPVLRQTKTGDAFLTFRMAVNERRWNAQENTWSDGASQFFSVTAFRTLAGNAYHSLAKGQHVMVSGRLRLSQYVAQDGSQRMSVQIDAHDIGASHKFGQTSFTKCSDPVIPSSHRLADDIVTEVTRTVENEQFGRSEPASDEEATEGRRALVDA
ncbi:single-stranded DNA-binding protein [Dermacoccus nishinomiyaensis]|uniref:single-stranded DNA-binding protein n=1 Tax=Dermacoccus nishinomiyaensis TaxID=1274 RepID=UPI000DFD874F|nr:single-stranded DNA-binding protein [Dermacoccus nishinomiyaensis]QQY25736.1 single-stranded DNA-binding protein [Dermacoccus nishinomiyaensis]STD16528.1 Helix-destabilizing protein [Dermacoccus nishinomiyaensis]